MTQLAHHPAYQQIENQLQAVGRRYRLQKIVRGVMIWAAVALAATAAAALAADFLGQGAGSGRLLAFWIALEAASFILLLAPPLMTRPKPVQVARLIESRLPDLHNGLTNSVLLAHAQDLQDNPWMGQVFDEVLAASASRGKSVDQSVKASDLLPLAKRLSFIVIPIVVLGIFLPGKLLHGFQQMLQPAAFVKRTGPVRIVEVQPGDVTLVAGQPLEITVLANGTGGGAAAAPDGRLIVRTPGQPETSFDLPANASPEKQELRYAYRIEHVDQTMVYRVEIGTTQSDLFTATVVKQVTAAGLTVRATAPAYTQRPPQTWSFTPAQLPKANVEVAQGSTVDLDLAVDVPIRGAMLQVADRSPTAMRVTPDGLHCLGTLTALEDAPLAVLLTDGTGQIIARLPEPPFNLRVARDMPPTIEMRWPTQDVSVPPDRPVRIAALLKDDWGVTSARVLMSTTPGGPMQPTLASFTYLPSAASEELLVQDVVPAELRRHGQTVQLQIEVTDNRDLTAVLKDGGPQTVASPIFQIRFADPQRVAAEEKQQADLLSQRLMEMLKLQRELQTQAVTFQAGRLPLMRQIGSGQDRLRQTMVQTAQTFTFDEQTKIIQKMLLVLAYNPAREAIDLAAAIVAEPVAPQQVKLNGELLTRQRRIISALESMLALLKPAVEPTAVATKAGSDMPNRTDAYKKLDEALKAFMAQEKRILDQTAGLAKKPVDDYTDADKKLLEELKMAQEKMDAFMQQQVSDFSKLAQQDLSNSDLLKDLMQVYSEVTMAKDALNKQAAEIAVPAEESGLEMAKEISSNIEKWLSNAPDRQQWNMEDPLSKTDLPMAELPKELEDMVGELMEQQEDLFQQMEDTNSNWADSMDKGIGWDAADGPIADMSAKGVTGNVLPNDNEMNGRSGEGRSGKSNGEFVGDSAIGKGGRNTPTRLDPSPFQQGQIKDTSKDPVGGATGGGKISGQGGEGLQGPVPPQLKQEMQRLAQNEAELRNTAERLNLQYKVGRYDNFKLLGAIALMRRVESDLKSNRYQNAMRRKDELLDDLDASHLLLAGEIHVQHDTSPSTNQKTRDEINDVMKGQLPAAWSDALKEYYKKLSQE